MLFATFHDGHGSFFYAKFHSYVLTVYSNGVFESFQFFFIFCKKFNVRWLIFSSDLLSLYPAVHFLSMWLIGIMAIMNSKRDRASSWKMPIWIFVSAMLLSPAVSSTLQVCMVFSMKFITSCDILYILRSCIIQLCETISYPFLKSIQAIARFVRLV